MKNYNNDFPYRGFVGHWIFESSDSSLLPQEYNLRNSAAIAEESWTFLFKLLTVLEQAELFSLKQMVLDFYDKGVKPYARERSDITYHLYLDSINGDIGQKIDYLRSFIEDKCRVEQLYVVDVTSMSGNGNIRINSVRKSFDYVLALDGFRFTETRFAVSTHVDCWLPVNMDGDMQLEVYQENLHRLEDTLSEIQRMFSCIIDPEPETIYQSDVGCLQLGFKLFNSRRMVEKHDWGTQFNINDYLSPLEPH